MITEAAWMPIDEDVGSFLNKGKFLTDNIFLGAMMNQLLERAIDEDLSPQEINLMDSCRLFSVTDMTGGEKVASSQSRDMMDDDNYLTDTFGKDDYLMLCGNIPDSYSRTDPEWCESLIDKISSDLQNPNVHFILIKVCDPVQYNDYRMAACMKVKHMQGGQPIFYVGSLYVVPEFQQYHIADFLQFQVEKVIERNWAVGSDYLYCGAVSIFNPAMERHIEKTDGIVTSVIREKNDQRISRELFQVEFNHKVDFKTKKLGQEDIVKMATFQDNANDKLDVDCQMKIRVLDTSEDENTAYLQLLKADFEEGYVVTRFFYSRVNGKHDLRRTFIVLEKPVIPISPCPVEMDE